MLPRLQVLLEAADKFACTYEDKEAMAARARVLGALQVTALYIVLLHTVLCARHLNEIFGNLYL